MRQHATLILPGPLVLGKPTYATMRFKKKLERTWRFAGGKIEDDETPREAMAREAKEELGITVTNMRIVSITYHHADGEDWAGHWILALDWQGDPSIQETEKHADLVFLTVAELWALGAEPEASVVSKL